MMSHVTVTILVIIYYIEEYRRFWNDNVILYKIMLYYIKYDIIYMVFRLD